MGVEKNKVSFTILMQFMIFFFDAFFWIYILLNTNTMTTCIYYDFIVF